MRITFDPSVTRSAPVRRSGVVRAASALHSIAATPDVQEISPVAPVSPLGREMAARQVEHEGESENGTLQGRRFTLMNNLAKSFG